MFDIFALNYLEQLIIVKIGDSFYVDGAFALIQSDVSDSFHNW